MCRSLYFGMDLVMGLAEAKLDATESEFGVEMGYDEYEFLCRYVQLLVALDLARVDFDDWWRYWDAFDRVTRFLAPLTNRGLQLVEYISSLDAEPQIRVIQDKSFQGILPFEIERRVPVTERFKQLRPWA